ncbi:MAG: phosphatase PAP2 family protein [Rikenellaceae bacterium]
MIEPSALDLSIFHFLNGDGGEVMDAIMVWVSGRLSWVFLYALMLWGVFRKVGWKNFLWFILAVALIVTLADQTCNLAKNNFSKFRPMCYEPLQGLIHTVEGYKCGLYGTFSSHAANTMGVSVLVAAIIGRRWVWWGLMIWVALICYSRIYLAAHYPYDIFFGLVVGSVYGWLFAVLYSKFILKKKKRK